MSTTEQSPGAAARVASRRLRCSLSALAMLFLSLPLAAAPDPRAAKYYEDALLRYEKKDLAGAIIQLKNALQIDKNQLPVQVLLGKALLANGEAAAAEVALTEALRLGVNRAELIVPLAESFLAQGKHKLVLTDVQFSPAGLPTAMQVSILLLRASASGDLGDLRGAMKSIDDARAIDPRSVEAVLAEVPIRIRVRQIREAVAAADRALAMAPNSAEAWYQKGTVLHVSGAAKEAASAYERALKASPDHTEAKIALIGLHIDFGQYADAAREVAELRRSAPREPRGAYLAALLAERENKPAIVRNALQEVTELIDPVPLDFIRYRPQTLMLNGLAHLGLNEPGKAKPFLEGFLRAQGASPVSKLLAQVYITDREAGKAIPILEEYLKLQPSDAQAINLLAAAHMAEGRHAKASTMMQDALKAQDTPDMRTTLGLSLIGSGRSEDALAHLEAAFRKDNGQTQAGTALAGLYLRSNEAAKAAAVTEAMLKKQPNSPGLYNLLGMAHAAAGSVAAARTAYETAIRLDPKLTAAHLNLARLEASTKAWDAATNRLNRLLKENERNPDIHFEMALLAERRGQPDETRRWLEKSADFEGPRQVRAALALVELHLRYRRPAPALDAAKRASSKLPDDIGVLLALATAQLANGDTGSARSALTGATRLAEYKAPVLVRIASLQVSARDLPGAAYSLDKALAGTADYVPAMALMTEVEIRQGDFVKAEKRARQTIEKQPKLAIGHRLLGDVARARGQRTVALESYRRAHQLEPSTATLLNVFAMLADQDKGRPALQLADQWLKAHPTDSAVRRVVADTQARHGNFAAARTSYEGLLKVLPDDAGAMNNLANVLFRLNDPGAVAMAERALAKDPGNAEIIDTLGWLLLQTGQSERALQLLRDARLRNPSNPDIRYHLAEALTKGKRPAEAREELKEALKDNRNFEHRSAAEALLRKLGP